MKVLLENEFVRSWVVGSSPIIFTVLLKQPENSIMLQQFCDLHEQYVGDLKKNFTAGVYSICDASVMQPFEFEILVNYYAHIFPKQQRAGLAYKCFVIPKGYDLEFDFEAVLKKLSGRPIGIYTTLEDAYAHVHELSKVIAG
jgi:hypothetical protein